MGIGVDIRLDAEGDFLIVDGDLQLTQTIEQEVFQRLRHKLNVWKGEWWYDQSFGTPYRQSILKKTTKSVVDAEFVKILRADPQVTEVVEFESRLNRTSRVYDLRFIVRTTQGTSLNFIATSDPASSEYLYPEAGGSFAQSSCAGVGDRIEYANQLYTLVNFTLPPWPDESHPYRFIDKPVFDEAINEEWPES